MKYINCVLIILFSFSVQAKEQLGTFSISDYLLRTSFLITESDGAEFNLDRSNLFFDWKHKKNLRAQLGLGSVNLVNPSVFSNTVTSVSQDWGFFEAFAEWDSGFGDLRAGLVPLNFGYEGSLRESERIFPDSLFLENRYVGLRDYGASYKVSHNGYYVHSTIHNGEGGSDTDGQMWFTSKLGRRNRAGLDLAISGQVGKFKTTTDTKNRIFGVYSAFNLYKINFVAEIFLGDAKSNLTYQQFQSWHVDLTHPIGDLAVHLRYDNLDPNKSTLNDGKSRWTGGFSLSNEERTSTLYLWAINNLEQGTKLNNNQILMSWQINSVFL